MEFRTHDRAIVSLMIELMNIRKAFNLGKPNEFVAVHEVSVSIDLKRVTVLKGPSGSGKTTLLSIIGCMARPTSGRIKLLDREITSLPERFLTWRSDSKEMGY
jgi:putative ABC transport system ATP-binding protein